ncbi:MAG: hypothetical protein WCV93_04080 [Candidatus Shapirobacteria bacterium]
MEFIKKYKITLLLAVVLAIVLCFFTFPFKNKSYIFDWDQANDYEAVAKIAAGKFTLIGPRVTSDNGFFLGPWHYYFLIPFFVITHGSLDMGFFAVLLVQYLFVITSFILVKKWFGTLAALTVGVFFATQANIVAWGFMYVPLLSLLFFSFCLKTIKNPKFLPLLFLLFGFGCTTYAVFYALIFPLTYISLSLLIQQKTTWKQFFLGAILATVPYTPLLIFDLRHNFLNIKNMLGFAGGQAGSGAQAGYFTKVFFRALEVSWLNQEFAPYLSFIIVILTLVILIVGALVLFKKNKLFIFIWLLSSLIPLAFFKGNVSEYYYAPVILLTPIFLSGFLVKKGKIGQTLLVALILLLVGLRLKDKYFSPSGVVLTDKIAVVKELEKLNTKYSISYELGLGQNSGYDTIFKTIGKNYVADGSSPLYTITYPNTPISGTLLVTTGKLSIYKR